MSTVELTWNLKSPDRYKQFISNIPRIASGTRLQVFVQITQGLLSFSNKVRRLTFDLFTARKNLCPIHLQSTLVISNSKGLSKILRDIRTSTYQICRLEEKINRTTAFNKCRCNWTLEVRYICWKYCGKEEKLLLWSNFSSFPQYFVTCY